MWVAVVVADGLAVAAAAAVIAETAAAVVAAAVAEIAAERIVEKSTEARFGTWYEDSERPWGSKEEKGLGDCLGKDTRRKRRAEGEEIDV